MSFRPPRTEEELLRLQQFKALLAPDDNGDPLQKRQNSDTHLDSFTKKPEFPDFVRPTSFPTDDSRQVPFTKLGRPPSPANSKNIAIIPKIMTDFEKKSEGYNATSPKSAEIAIPHIGAATDESVHMDQMRIPPSISPAPSGSSDSDQKGNLLFLKRGDPLERRYSADIPHSYTERKMPSIEYAHSMSDLLSNSSNNYQTQPPRLMKRSLSISKINHKIDNAHTRRMHLDKELEALEAERAITFAVEKSQRYVVGDSDDDENEDIYSFIESKGPSEKRQIQILQKSTLFSPTTQPSLNVTKTRRCCKGLINSRHFFIALMIIVLTWALIIVVIVLSVMERDHDEKPLPFLIVGGIGTITLYLLSIINRRHHILNKKNIYQKRHLKMTSNLRRSILTSHTFLGINKANPYVVGTMQDEFDEDSDDNPFITRGDTIGNEMQSYENCYRAVKEPVCAAAAASFGKSTDWATRFSTFVSRVRRWFITGRFEKKRVNLNDKRTYYLHRAVGFIEDQSYRTLLIRCHLEGESRDNSIVWALFWVYSSYIFSWVMLIMFAGSLLLSFEDSKNLVPGTYAQMVQLPNLGLEVVTLAVFIFSAVMGILTHYKFADKNNIESSASGKLQYSLYACVVAWTFMTFLIKVATKFNLEAMVPSRAFLPILYTHQIAYAARMYIKSVVRAKQVILIYFVFVILTGSLSFLINSDPNVTGRPFGNFLSTLTTVYIYVSTGENYTELVYNALDNPNSGQQSFEIAFWIITAVFGLFIIMPVVVAVFEHAYSEQQRQIAQKNRMFERLKYAAAFTLLNDLTPDQEDLVTKGDFQAFINVIEGGYTKGKVDAAMRIFTQMDSDGNGTLDVKEFCEGIECLFSGTFAVLEEPSFRKWRLIVRRFVNSYWFQKFIVLTIIWQIWMTTMYDVDAERNYILTNCIVFIFVITLSEIALKLIAYGLPMFWNTTTFKRAAVLTEFTNRFELMIVIMSIVCIIIGRIGVVEEQYIYFWYCFPAIRLFTLVKQMSYISYALSKALSPFFFVTVLLFVVFYVYAVLGMVFFREVEQSMFDDGYDYDANFHSLFRSFLTLFQLFVGEAFYEIMYHYADKTSKWAIYYFVSFVALVSLLFGNLFFGMILSIFSKLYDRKKATMKSMNAAVLVELVDD